MNKRCLSIYLGLLEFLSLVFCNFECTDLSLFGLNLCYLNGTVFLISFSVWPLLMYALLALIMKIEHTHI